MLNISKNLSSSVSIAAWTRAGRPGFDSRQGQGIFLFSTSSWLALGGEGHQHPIRCVPGIISPGVTSM